MFHVEHILEYSSKLINLKFTLKIDITSIKLISMQILFLLNFYIFLDIILVVDVRMFHVEHSNNKLIF